MRLQYGDHVIQTGRDEQAAASTDNSADVPRTFINTPTAIGAVMNDIQASLDALVPLLMTYDTYRTRFGLPSIISASVADKLTFARFIMEIHGEKVGGA